MVFAIYVPYFMDIPPESDYLKHLITGLLIIYAIVDLIFLLNYVSIELRIMRRAEPGTLKEYGTFISIKRNI